MFCICQQLQNHSLKKTFLNLAVYRYLISFFAASVPVKNFDAAPVPTLLHKASQTFTNTL
jgi:hypothetical protein